MFHCCELIAEGVATARTVKTFTKQNHTDCCCFSFSARFLITNIKPFGVGVIFPVLGLLGLYFSMAFLLKTGCIDSGVVPRALPDEIAYMQSQGDEGGPCL